MHNMRTFSSTRAIATEGLVRGRYLRARDWLGLTRAEWCCSDPVPSEQNSNFLRVRDVEWRANTM